MNRKLRLLVVEDEAAISSGLRDVFVYHGYDVTCVADGAEGRIAPSATRLATDEQLRIQFRDGSATASVDAVEIDPT